MTLFDNVQVEWGTSNLQKNNILNIWTAHVSSCLSYIVECEAILSMQEKLIAQRFYRNCDRYRFIVTRAMLRSLLAHIIGITPPEVIILKGRYGKPFLAAIPTKNRII